MSVFEKTDLNRVRRVAKRGIYDKERIYEIVDDALICHVGFVADGRPFVIPTLHARVGDEILLHGATTSRLMRHAGAGHELCITVTHVDGVVLARSVFNHSMNYRSAVLFGRGRAIVEDEAKMAALEAFTNRLMPGRWAAARPPNDKELKATTVVAVTIESASAKARSGPPVDEEEDYVLPHWAGVLPLHLDYGHPVTDEQLPEGIEVPGYVWEAIDG